MPRIYLEKDYLQDAFKSVAEEYTLEKKEKSKKVSIESQKLDEKTRVKNHFRNVCFRKKFQTLTEHIKYIAKYYELPELVVATYISEDLPFIKSQTGLK